MGDFHATDARDVVARVEGQPVLPEIHFAIGVEIHRRSGVGIADVRQVSRDVAGGRTGQIKRRSRNILGLTERAQRNLLQQLGAHLRVQLRGHVRLDETRRDGVACDTPRSQLARDRLREADQARLARGVIALPRVADEADDGGDIDDATG